MSGCVRLCLCQIGYVWMCQTGYVWLCQVMFGCVRQVMTTHSGLHCSKVLRFICDLHFQCCAVKTEIVTAQHHCVIGLKGLMCWCTDKAKFYSVTLYFNASCISFLTDWKMYFWLPFTYFDMCSCFLTLTVRWFEKENGESWRKDGCGRTLQQCLPPA